MRSASLSAILFFLASLFHGSGVFAQDVQDGPANVELKAAYCLKVIQSRDMRFCTTAPAPALAECRNEQINVERLKYYLAVRAHLFGERDPTPVVVAGNRGGVDFEDCIETAHSNLIEECSKKCFGQKDLSTCFDACPLPDSCRRVRECNDLSFLPF